MDQPTRATTSGSESGLTLIEVLIALFLIAIGVLAVAPMFMYAMQDNATGEDFGSAGALAMDKMEELRLVDWDGAELAVGGGLDANQPSGAFSSSSDGQAKTPS